MGTPSAPEAPDILYYADSAVWRRWLEHNHDRHHEHWVGFYKKDSGKPSLTWPESVDEALCFGWIDGLRKSIDATRYRVRFTPRKADSTWSLVNIRRVQELSDQGRMRQPGLDAFALRTDDNSAIYFYEQRHDSQFDPAHEALLRANQPAWEFFQARPLWYRKAATHWVISAKQEQTRQRRLATLIEDAAAGRPIKPLSYKPA